MDAEAASTPASIFTSVPQPAGFTFGTKTELDIGVAACRALTTGIVPFPELGPTRLGADADADGESNVRATLADALQSHTQMACTELPNLGAHARCKPWKALNFYDILGVPQGATYETICEAAARGYVHIDTVSAKMNKYTSLSPSCWDKDPAVR